MSLREPNSTSASQTSPWLPMAGVCGLYIAFGTAIGAMAPLVDEISADLELRRSTMGQILGAWAAVYVFTAIPAGAFVDRVGLRRSLFAGGVAIAGSLLLRASASEATGLFVAVALFGVGGPLISVGAPKLVSTLFDDDARRLPTGCIVASPGVGSAIALALTNPVLLPALDNDWRSVLRLFGVIALIAMLFWWWSSRRLAPAATAVTATTPRTFLSLLQLRVVRWVLAIGIGHFLFSHALAAWLPEILADRGLSDAVAGYLAALATAAGIAGSLLITRLVSAASRPFALAAIFGAVAACLAVISAAPVGLLIGVLAIMGFARAGAIPLLFLTLMDHPRVSTADIGAATGLFFAFGELGGFLGPYIVGAVADRFDGFGAAILVLAAVALVAMACSVLLGRLQPVPRGRQSTANT